MYRCLSRAFDSGDSSNSWLFQTWGLAIEGDIAEHDLKVVGGSYAKMAEGRLGTDEDKRLNADIVVK